MLSLTTVGLFGSLVHLGGTLAPFLVFNADHLYLPALFADLRDGGSLESWYVPYSAYFVTDWVLYWLASVITDSIGLQYVLMAGVQGIATAFLVALISRFGHGTTHWQGAVASISVLMALVALNTRPAVALATIYFRYSSLLLLLACLAISGWHLRSERPLASIGASALVTYLAVASDQIFLLWFVLPAAGALVALRLLGDQSLHWFQWVAAHALASGFAIATRRSFAAADEVTYSPRLSLGNWKTGSRGLREVLRTTVRQDGVWAFVVAGVAGTVLVGVLFARREDVLENSSNGRWLRFVAVFVPASAASGLLASVFLVGLPNAVRYWIPAMLLPLLVIPSVIPQFDTRARRSNQLVRATLALPPLVLVLIAATHIHSLDVPARPAYLDCVDEALSLLDGTAGLANYQQGRDLQVFSGIDAEFYVVDNLNRPFLLNNRLGPIPDMLRFAVEPVTGDFGGPNVALIEYTNAPPDSSTVCEGATIHTWDRPFALPQFLRAGDEYRWSTCDLPHTAEVVESGTRSSCERTVIGDEEPDFAFYGTRALGVSGRYEVEMDFAIVEAANDSGVAGTWEFVATYGPGSPIEIVSSGAIPAATGPLLVREIVSFSSDPSQRPASIEVRLRTQEGGLVVTRSISIRKL